MKEKFYSEITVGDSKYPLERYLVVFLDILGQKRTLSKLQADFKEPFSYDKEAPRGELEIPEKEFSSFFKSFAPVWQFRKKFVETFELTKQKQLERHSHLNTLTIPINFESSSDNIWIWAPLKNNGEYSEMLTILVILQALMVSYIDCTADEIPLRGGVTISYGFEMPNYKSEDKNYYGPGLARAAKLEKEALFPRIILDEIVYDLISLYKKNRELSKDPYIKTSGQLADTCLTYIKEYTAPYLDEGVEKNTQQLSLIPPLSIPQLNEIWDDAIKFANSEIINNNADKKIANKYRNLSEFLTKFKKPNRI